MPLFKNEKYKGPFILNQGMFLFYTYPFGMMLNWMYFGKISRKILLPYSTIFAMAYIQYMVN